MLNSIKYWHYLLYPEVFYLLGTVISSCKNASHPILVLAPQCTLGCKFVRYPSTAGYFDSLNPALPNQPYE